MKVHKLSDETYAVQFRVVSQCTTDEFYNYIENEAGVRPEKSADVRPWNSLFEGMEINGEIFCFIYLSDKYLTLQGLVHELIHACIFIFEVRGIPINVDSDEAFAWYYDVTLDKLTRQKILGENHEKRKPKKK